MGLSVSAAARQIGMTRRAVDKAIERKAIALLADGTIDPESVAAFPATRRASRGGATKARPKVASPPVPASADGEKADNARAALAAVISGGVFASRAEAELARDSYVAHLRQIELEKERGRLLDRDVVEKAVAAGCSKVRTRLLALPSERAPAIARLKTAVEVEDALRAAVTEALEEMAEHFAKGL